MREILNHVISMYHNYNGAGMQMALFFACLVYLIVSKKESSKRYLFLGYTILFFAICFFPVTAQIIMDVCIGRNVYWRMFWLLPCTIVIAYTAAVVISRMEGKIKRYGLLVFMLLIVIMTGTNVYNGTIFNKKQNYYKLSQDAIDICDMIEQDAAANGITHKKLITENNLIESIRQYDADILMPYGYNAVMKNKTDTPNAHHIYQLMSCESKNWESIAWYAAMEECNYLAYPAEEAAVESLSSLGYEVVGANETYYVYRRDLKETDYQGEWLITQYGAVEGSQQMFYTIQDAEGHLIVVDGGWADGADYVRTIIKEIGNHVDAWIITHPHRDHAGAFTEIYKNRKKMKVDRVYAVDMASPDVCLKSAPWDETEVYEKWLNLDIENLEYVHAGDSFEVAGLKFDILNAYDDYVGELSDDLLNDGSMMFKITAKDQSMLFCADVGKKMSDYLLEQHGDLLKADYIQMGHHGNGGLKSDFYQFVEAKAAFFDAPAWLMQDVSGRYTTVKNAHLMAENGAAVYSFSTTPNQIILK